MATIRTVQTSHLNFAYEERGDPTAPVVLLLHGWPDDVRTWDVVVEELVRAGYRTITPYLRGFGPTMFRSQSLFRSGQLSALGRDVVELIEELNLRDLTLVGHDWGARAAYIVAALNPERLRGLVAISVGYGTNIPGQVISYAQARLYWYHWFFATDRGRVALESDRGSLCRYLWETWSPSWRFTQQEFETTAAPWNNPDWVTVTIHSYRHRWGNSAGDPDYEEIESRLAEPEPIQVPTIVLHGADDGATLPETSANRDRLFRAGYEREVILGAGHFVPRENPNVVLAAILKRAKFK
jgi:pimeloyl-ACP methyl ester carboxylesterase